MNKNKQYNWVEKRPGTYNYMPQKLMTLKTSPKNNDIARGPVRENYNGLNYQKNNKINNIYSNQYQYTGYRVSHDLHETNDSSSSSSSIYEKNRYRQYNYGNKQEYKNNNNKQYGKYANITLKSGYKKNNNLNVNNNNRRQNYSKSGSFCSRKSCNICNGANKNNKYNNKPKPKPPRSVSYDSKRHNLKKRDTSSTTSYGTSESCNCSKCKKKYIADNKLKEKIMKKFGNKKILSKLDASDNSLSDIKCDNIKCKNCYS